MLGRKILIFAFLFICAVPSALAQGNYEVAPFFGGKMGGRITFQNNPFFDYDKIKSSGDFGVLFGYNVWDTFQAEFMWNRQPTTITAHNTNGTFSTLGNTNMDMYNFDLLYPFRSTQAKFRPFLAAGMGWTHFGNGDSLIGFSNRFSYNLGGGVKYYFSQVVGVRLDVRYLATRTTPTQSQQCDPFGCFTIQTTAHAKQGEANVGLIFRF